MEITIHEEKINHFTFHGEKKGPITSHENTLNSTLKQAREMANHNSKKKKTRIKRKGKKNSKVKKPKAVGHFLKIFKISKF